MKKLSGTWTKFLFKRIILKKIIAVDRKKSKVKMNKNLFFGFQFSKKKKKKIKKNKKIKFYCMNFGMITSITNKIKKQS